MELGKTSKKNVHFPFGNSVWEFWSTFQEIPFSQENLHSGTTNKVLLVEAITMIYKKEGIFKWLIFEKIEFLSSICAWSIHEHKSNERRSFL